MTALAQRTNWERGIAISYKPGPNAAGGGGDYYLHSCPYDAAGNAATQIPDGNFLAFHTHIRDARRYLRDYGETDVTRGKIGAFNGRPSTISN